MTRQGAKAYLVASGFFQASALVRYVILARVLGPEQLGLAAILILTAQFFDSISDTGSDRFLVQNADGGSPSMLNLVQAAMAVRGVAIAIALALSASLLATLYRTPELTGALVALSMAPLIAGFQHMGVRQAQRQADFRPESAVIFVGETASLLGTGVAAFIVRDHTAVLYGLVLRSIAIVATSHIVSREPYRWGFSRPEGLAFSKFAAPLFLNGLLLFLGSQGDRMLIGGMLGPAALGHYSAILLLIVHPTSALSKFLAGMHLSPLAAARDDRALFRRSVDRLGGQTIALGLLMALGFAVVAPVLTPVLYGRLFTQPLGIFALLGVLQTLRFLRFWPNTVAVSIGRSSHVMMNNIARMTGLPVALVAYAISPSLEGVIAGFILGELVALAFAIILLDRTASMSARGDLLRVAIFVATSALIITAATALDDGQRTAGVAAILAAASMSLLLAWRERSLWIGLLAMATSRIRRRS